MPVTVLVCENEDVLRTLVRATLGGRGYEIAEARDGDESLAVARRTKPDLIILDLLMPGRSGLEVLGELRRDPAFAQTRVIVLTALALPFEYEAVRGEADRFLPKPFSPRELATVVDELLGSSDAPPGRGNGSERGPAPRGDRERWAPLVRARVAWAQALAAEEEHELVDAGGERRGPTQGPERVSASERARDAPAAGDAIAVVSHELRTPLSGILGVTEILLSRAPDEDTRTHLELIQREVERLTALTDTLLQLERPPPLRPAPFQLDRLLEESVTLFSAQTGAHSLTLDLPAGSLEVVADRDRIAQVVANLLSNAIKYSPGGGAIRISALRLDEQFRVAVEDDGVGIPPELHGRVFSRFFRAESAAAGLTQGAGLGLALSREIIAAHGGEMGFESEDGVGSTFWFTLPRLDSGAT